MTYSTLDKYADVLEGTLEEKKDVEEALEHLETLIADEDVTIEEVVAHFTVEYCVTPEDYVANIESDSRWAVENDISENTNADGSVPLLDNDFDHF